MSLTTIDRFNTKTAQKIFFLLFNFHISLSARFLTVPLGAALAVLLAVITFGVNAQSITWQKVLNDDYGWLNKTEQTNDGGFIAVGEIRVNYQAKIYLVKLDFWGNILWTKILGVGENQGNWVEETSDNGFIIGGSTDSGLFGEKAYIIKTDINGNIQWEKTFSNSDLDQCYCLKQTPDGGYILSNRTTPGNADIIMFIKTDSLGNEIWRKIYGSIFTTIEELEISNNGYFAVGFVGNFCYVMKLNLQGDTIWTKKYGGDFDSYGYSIDKINNMEYIIGGYSKSFNINHKLESYVCKIDTGGNIIWQRTYSNLGEESCISIRYKPDVGFVLAGYSDSLNNYYGCAKIRLLDVNGNLLYENSYKPNSEGSSFYSIELANDGGFIAAGDAVFSGAAVRMYLIKTDSLLNSNPIGIINISNHIPRIFKLYQNFPNPFNSGTNIKFDIKNKTNAKLIVYDVLGREIKKIFEDNLKAGTYEITYNAADLASGVYYYRLFIDNYIETKKMVLLK